MWVSLANLIEIPLSLSLSSLHAEYCQTDGGNSHAHRLCFPTSVVLMQTQHVVVIHGTQNYFVKKISWPLLHRKVHLEESIQEIVQKSSTHQPHGILSWALHAHYL